MNSNLSRLDQIMSIFANNEQASLVFTAAIFFVHAEHDLIKVNKPVYIANRAYRFC